jgi:glycosyltransferase involved in cell wall biosynthesis
VAVVIPCFNDGATVMESVQSAIRENAAEIVVVDDGSTDSVTVSVLATLPPLGVRVITQENCGLSGARMRGVQETTSPFVMVLDADDCIAPGALGVMANHLASNQRLAVVWGDIERIGAAGYLVYPKGHSLDPWRITHVNELVASTMVRRSSLVEAGGWTLETAYEDWDLWMAMAEKGMEGEHVGVVTLHYRVDEPRMYRKAIRDHDELVRILRSRHRGLFDERRQLRRNSGAPRRLKWAWATIDGLPLRESIKRRLYFGTLIACEPGRRHRRRRSSAVSSPRARQRPTT